MEVLLAAAKKGRVDELSQVARGANLNPAVIDVDMLALMNAFELNYPDEIDGHVISLVHLGASMMTVLIVKDGFTYLSTRHCVGRESIHGELQKALGLSREEAEAVKLGAQPGKRRTGGRAHRPAEGDRRKWWPRSSAPSSSTWPVLETNRSRNCI